MGAWGPKLYQDDIAQYIKSNYLQGLREGRHGVDITQDLVNRNQDILVDIDDAPIFWFALADTQWELGRLEEAVKIQALYHINSGHNLLRWREESPKHSKAREEILTELEKKLLSPQPKEKKVRPLRLFRCSWKIGDVYAYPLVSDYARERGLDGRFLLLHKIDETVIPPGHIIPIARVKITKDLALPQNPEEFDKLEYVQVKITEYEDRFKLMDEKDMEQALREEKKQPKYKVDDFGYLPQYKLKLLDTSKQCIPKDLIYVDNYSLVSPPDNEFTPYSKLGRVSKSKKRKKDA